MQILGIVTEVSKLLIRCVNITREIVGVGQVRVVEQVTLERKLCGQMHRPFKLYPISPGARYPEPDDNITLVREVAHCCRTPYVSGRSNQTMATEC